MKACSDAPTICGMAINILESADLEISPPTISQQEVSCNFHLLFVLSFIFIRTLKSWTNKNTPAGCRQASVSIASLRSMVFSSSSMKPNVCPGSVRYCMIQSHIIQRQHSMLSEFNVVNIDVDMCSNCARPPLPLQLFQMYNQQHNKESSTNDQDAILWLNSAFEVGEDVLR